MNEFTLNCKKQINSKSIEILLNDTKLAEVNNK